MFIGLGDNHNLSDRSKCEWAPPPQGWFKLNFDGASRGNPGIVGIGCIIHSREREEVVAITKPIGSTTNNVVEATAVVEGMLLCHEIGIQNLEIEGDSTIIINSLRSGNSCNWKINNLIKRAKDLLPYFNSVIINHIYREGNRRADELANIGADGKELKILGKTNDLPDKAVPSSA
ncbi:hypothetical protein SUGI_1042530 [Cryptomeria japonica]|nr:hypothetical protein SUGI_1042530 [Cryptomeria japonica]